MASGECSRPSSKCKCPIRDDINYDDIVYYEFLKQQAYLESTNPHTPPLTISEPNSTPYYGSQSKNIPDPPLTFEAPDEEK